MKKLIRKFGITSMITLLASTVSLAAAEQNGEAGTIKPMVVKQFLNIAKKNTDWKRAFATGEHEQIVFMNVSPLTNPKNEVGMEVHPFDQVILIVEGDGRVVLNGKTSLVTTSDLIFIPKGTSHNVINLDRKKELKLISFYSDRDIPKDAVYKKKADDPES